MGVVCFKMAFLKRLKKEYMDLKKNPPPGVVMDDSIMENNLTKFVDLTVAIDGPALPLIMINVSFSLYIFYYSWVIHISGAEGTLYNGEHFKLNIKFSDKYPFDSPQVHMNNK